MNSAPNALPDMNASRRVDLSSVQSLLVTGGAGFIGSNFVSLAVKQGIRVTVLDALTYAGHRENLEGIANAELVVGDIGNQVLTAHLLQQHQVDAVVHFAAESHVDRSIARPEAFIATNIVGTFQLLGSVLEYWQQLPAPQKVSFRYLHVSTDEVYGSLGASGKFSETTAYAPNSPYSASKAASDHLVRAWHHTYGLPTLTTHCSNNYGPKQFPEKLIPTLIFKALKQQPLPIYGNGEHVRDWIHVQDHCHGILLALARGKPGASYCFGGDAEHTNTEVAHQLCSILDEIQPRQDGVPHARAIAFVSDRLGHDLRYAIDDRLAQRDLQFARKFSFASGLRETIEWYLQHPQWVEAVMKKSGTNMNQGVLA